MIEYKVKVYDDRTEWWLNDKLHKEDGPAIEWEDGGKQWYLNGKLYRENGPASEFPNGYKAWYLNDKLHRKDGPAVEYPNGYKEWWLNGEEVTEEEVMGKKTLIEEEINKIKIKVDAFNKRNSNKIYNCENCNLKFDKDFKGAVNILNGEKNR